MRTLASILGLIFMGVVVNFLAVFVLNIAGIPGALIAGKPGKRSNFRFIFGSTVSAFGQSFVYLAYTTFVIKSILFLTKHGVSLVIWIVAFLAVIVPLWFNLMHARVEAREMKFANAQTEALHLTFVITLIGFLIFAFFPSVMQIIYGWVPYVKF